MKSSAYLIEDGYVICTVNTELKNGTSVRFGYETCEEALDANRDFNLVNARDAKISRAKKWDKAYLYRPIPYGKEINPAEFYINQDND